MRHQITFLFLLQENNQTVATEFFLLGFQVNKCLRLLLFSILFFINCCTLCGNLLIIALVSTSRNLHTPMYFFIAQLSINDILLTSDIVPIMLHILLNNGATITYIGCIAQFFFFCASEAFECFLLTVMSYDRYVAICNPLHYPSIMTSGHCIKIITICCRQKAFSTCSSHLIVVSIFYCSLFSVYVVPTKGQTQTISKILSLLYTVCTPFINPMIYSLRNKDILKAVEEIIFLKTSLFGPS
ncbi:hypothetical protein GDO81_017833 [Engystomops pustulosus]|uniref:G-protein coupled receptors family 1 profile domain-containing protein n=1 Tax=Engystomops pustulosus TaxID=76066 RepID=A0AAV7A2L0_ENGPU|nr:hypothetical protein GDO81_017833 [Engystomops pustulosus]